jgi:hypothetical protein
VLQAEAPALYGSTAALYRALANGDVLARAKYFLVGKRLAPHGLPSDLKNGEIIPGNYWKSPYRVWFEAVRIAFLPVGLMEPIDQRPARNMPRWP